MRKPADRKYALKIIQEIGLSVIRQKRELAETHIETLYFVLIKNSFDFSLLRHIREKLGLLYDFILFLNAPESDQPELSTDYQTVTTEVEAIKKQFNELSDHVTGNIRDMKSVILSALMYAYMNYDNPNLILSDISAAVDRSPSYVSSLFTATIKIGFVEFLTRVRVRQAKRLIVGGGKVKDIANSVGISDQRYFSNVFKKYVGVTPSEYRKSMTGCEYDL
jgi:YesN/AraC family two-component response regulator